MVDRAPTEQEQAAFKAAQDAQNQRVHDEQLASIARKQAEDAANQKFYDENLSPQAQERQREAKIESDRENAAIINTAEALVVDTAYVGSRGGLATMGPLMGGAGIIGALLGFSSPQQPGANGPAPPPQNNTPVP